MSSLKDKSSYERLENWWQIDSKLSSSMTKLLSYDLSFDISEEFWIDSIDGDCTLLEEFDCLLIDTVWIEGLDWTFWLDFYTDEMLLLLLIDASETRTFYWLGLLTDLIDDMFDACFYTFRGTLLS